MTRTSAGAERPLVAIGRLFLATALAGGPWPASAADLDEFGGYEIRVIRPRYFTKTGRVELGATTNVIMNQAFIYTFLASGLLTYHVNEVWGLELQAGYGFSLDKDDKRLLKDDFVIRTVVLRTESLVNARFLWTPSYGKFTLTSGRIVYFDTFLAAGAGMTGVHYTYDHCDRPEDYPADVRHKVPEAPAATTRQYPTGVLGIGQRYFLDKQSSFRLGMDVQRFVYDTADAECQTGEGEGALKPHDSVLLVLGYTHFF